MSISFSGLASGLDTSSWVESLTALKRAKVETYQAEKQNLLLSQQTLNSIKNFFNSFRSVIERVTDTKFGVGSLDLFAQNLAISSKANILTATANSEAQEGTYTINVNNLASNTQASSGYSQITTQTVSATATLDSTLTSIGVKTGQIGIDVDGIERRIYLGNNETIQSFIDKLSNIGVQASYNEKTGVFNIKLDTSDIKDIGNTGIVDALHLEGINEGYTSETLLARKTDTVWQQATQNTKLSELGVKEGSLYLSNRGSNVQLDINTNWTINDFIYQLNNKGLEASFSADGYLSLTESDDIRLISDGSTNLFEVMGWGPSAEPGEINSTTQTSKPLQYYSNLTESTAANRDTLLQDIDGVTVNNGDTIIVKNSNNVTSTITLSNTSTIGDVLDSLNDTGMHASINSSGIVTISDGQIIGGTFDIAAALGLDVESTTSSATSTALYVNKTIAKNTTSTAQVTYTEARDAVASDFIGDFIDLRGETWVYIKNDLTFEHSGYVVNDVEVDDTWTFQDLFNFLDSYGISATMNNGVISLTNNGENYLHADSGIGKLLGIGITSNTETSTVTNAVTKTSARLYYTTTVVATGSSNIADYVDLSTNLGSGIYGSLGTIFASGSTVEEVITVANSYSDSSVITFNDLFETLNFYGINATMTDGVITLDSTSGAYVKGDLFDQLGINNYSTTITCKHNGNSSTAPVVYTVTSSTTENPTPSYEPLSEDSIISDWWQLPDDYHLRVKLFNASNHLTISSEDLVGDFDFAIEPDYTTFRDLITNINDRFVEQGFDLSKIRASWDKDSLIIESKNSSIYFVLDECGYGGYWTDGFSSVDSNFKYQRRGDHIDLSTDASSSIINANNTDYAAFKKVQLTYCVNENTYYQKSITGIEGISTNASIMSENSRVLDWWVGVQEGGGYYYLDTSVFTIEADYHTRLVYTITRDTTFADLINFLNSNEWINAKIIDNGSIKKLHITSEFNHLELINSPTFVDAGTDPTAHYYSTSSPSELTLNYYGAGGVAPFPIANSIVENTYTLTQDTTFGALGLNSDGTIRIATTDGQTKYITVTSSTTIKDLQNSLSTYNINSSVYNGKFQISETFSPYDYEQPNHITFISSNIVDALQLQHNGNQSQTYTITENTTSNKIEKISTTTANSTTRLKVVGQSGNKTITANYNGNSYSVVISDTMSVEDAISQINNSFGYMGINASLNNGFVSISSSNPKNAYITNFGGAFGMTGNGYTTNSISATSVTNTPSNRLQKEETVIANWYTTMEQLGYPDSDGFFRIYDSNGIERIVIIDQTDTIRDVRDKLAVYDIALNCSNGSITLSGTNGAYIDHISPLIANPFHIRSGSSRTYTTAVLTTADMDKQLGELYYESPYMDYNMELIVGDFDGKVCVNNNGVITTLEIDHTETLNELCSKFESAGVSCTINAQGQLQLSSNNGTYFYVEGVWDDGWSDLEAFGIDQSEWKFNTTYKSSTPVSVTNSSYELTAAKRDTLLSDLGITTGEYLLYKDGVKHTLYVSSDDTLGTFMSSLRSYGIESSLVTKDNITTIKLNASGNTYLASSNAFDSSNIVDELFDNEMSQTYTHRKQLGYDKTVSYTDYATEDTRIGDISIPGITRDTDQVGILFNGEEVWLTVKDDDTIGSFLDKIRMIGADVTMDNGQIVIQSGFNSEFRFNDPKNGPFARFQFSYSSDLGGYSASSTTVKSTDVIIENHNNSVANYANYDTKLNLLNISDGTLTLYRNGEKATIQVDSEQTFGDLRSKISAKFSDVSMTFENGYLKLSSSQGDVVVGTTTDSSNFAAITGMSSNEKGDSISSRSLYCVNNSSKVTNSGLFVRGQVTEGNFKVGNATINIDSNTTLNDIISQINYSDDSNATAFWDSIDGKFVIKSKTSGASLINIEAGTSNFTDIMGFTETKDGKAIMNTSSQTLGSNAVFTINGTRFTSTSNTVTSDISRIQGVTLYLKDISNGEDVTLTIEKDKETAANAMQDIVDAYNALIENVDKEVARGANLSGESTLRLIRNQIRSLMTSSIANSGSFKNLSSIGISLSAATTGNIRTDNIHQLSFDKDKFINAYSADLSSLKSLLVGTDNQKGILSQVENVLEQALGGVTGYFASAEKSYSNKISKLDDKITKTNKAADRYKARLESKFKAMDMIISKFQNQYSSFLG